MQINKKTRDEDICKRYASGEQSSKLANEYSLTKQGVIDIIRRNGGEVKGRGRAESAVFEIIECRYCNRKVSKNIVLKSKYCNMVCRKRHITKTDEEKRLAFNAYKRNYYKNKKQKKI